MGREAQGLRRSWPKAREKESAIRCERRSIKGRGRAPQGRAAGGVRTRITKCSGGPQVQGFYNIKTQSTFRKRPAAPVWELVVQVIGGRRVADAPGVRVEVRVARGVHR